MTTKNTKQIPNTKATRREDRTISKDTASLIATSLSQSLESPWYSLPVFPSLVSSFESYASLFDAFLAYKKTSMSPSDYAFFIKTTGGITNYLAISSTLKTDPSGKVDPMPLGDKIAALSLAVSEAPLYSLPHLTKLLQISASERRREAVQGLEAIVELFHNVPLICDNNNMDSALVTQLDRDTKSIYTNTLRLLEVHAHDQLEHGRHTACRLLSKLLLSPHITSYKQSTIVTILVNKMGDPDRKLASRIAYYLEQAWIERSIDPTTDVEMAVSKSMSVILKQEQKSKKKPRHKKKETQGSIGEEDGSEKAAYRVIYYAMTLLTQLKLRRDNPMTLRIINIYGLLFEHFVIAPHNNTVKGNDKKHGSFGKKDRKKGKKDVHTTHSYEFGRIAKLLLTGLARAIPFTNDQNGNDHLKKITTPLTSLAKTSENLALVWQSLGLLGMLKQNVLPELTKRLRRSSELIKYRGTHGMLLNLIEKHLYSNNFNDQAIVLLKKLLGLRCIGVLHADPLPMIKKLIDKYRELHSALRLPDDEVQGQSMCLWELTFLLKHFKSSQRLNTATILNGNDTGNGIAIGMREEMTDVEWLSAWSELKYTMHPDLDYLMTEYNVNDPQENLQKGKKGRSSNLEGAADKIVEDEMERMTGIEDGDDMSGLSEDEDMDCDEDDGDMSEDGIPSDFEDDESDKDEEDTKSKKGTAKNGTKKSVFAPAPDDDDDEEAVRMALSSYSKNKRQRH